MLRTPLNASAHLANRRIIPLQATTDFLSRRHAWHILALVWLGLAHAWAMSIVSAAAPAPMYSRVSPSADGIGKVYMGREISNVMSYHGANWLERAERLREEQPDRVLAALDLRPGMVVADVGAGTGYYARRIAQVIGSQGLVYAVDIQPEMLKLMERELARSGVSNVKPVLSTPTSLRLAPGSLDLAVMVDVYHELEHPFETMASIVQAVKSGGRIAFVEFRANDARVPIKALHTMSEEQVRREASVHGIEWIKTVRDLPWQHVIVFRKP